MIHRLTKTICCLVVVLAYTPAMAGAYRFQTVSDSVPAEKWQTVVGWCDHYTVKPNDTLLDISRNHGLGYNEMALLYPEMDPWLPGVGRQVTIPTLYVLPETKAEGVVINIAELRLYHFFPEIKMVKTYPVGIGTLAYETPVGRFKVISKKEDPVWVVPPSLRERYPFTMMPPGPRNPLGAYWLGLSAEHIGIHGTNFPWAIGRRVSRGCIRLYPEHIGMFYAEAPMGIPVEIVYAPVKVGIRDKAVYVEVHPDTEGRIDDMAQYARDRIAALGLAGCFSEKRLLDAITASDGVPVRIGAVGKDGSGGRLCTARRADGPVRGKIN